MHESESHSVMSDSLRPHGLYIPWNSLGENTGVGSLSLLQGIFPTQGLNPGLPHCRRIFFFFLQADFLPAEPQGKPKNTGVGSVSLLQKIFLAQELNQGLPLIQADSLPTELSGKPFFNAYSSFIHITK